MLGTGSLMMSGKSTGRMRPARKSALWLRWVIVLAVIVASTDIAWCLGRSAGPEAASKPAVAAAGVAEYVGSHACASCHAAQFAQWRASHHQAAMAVASGHSVLGNFDNSRFSHAGVASTFFKRGDRFYVRTDGPDGKPADYQIRYTFGISPLQQYLVSLADGRLQALSVAWDSRAPQQGGQRWFDLYPEDHITYQDVLYWTQPSHNWNFMCADCHSTDLHKNYDAAADTFKSSWSEISVGCEACHGPGSRHLRWAKLKQAGRPFGGYANLGLTVRLDERRDVAWTIDPNTGNAVRSRPRTSDREIQVCAQCHSRRGQIADGYQAGKPFLDYYRPAFLVAPLYHADGQQQGEVYNWGSFLQSRMYAHGVTCSDCHDPHSTALRAPGNALCSRCHLASKYDTEQHYHHAPGSAGAQCVACHMPSTNYMVVDPRRDHSIRLPRPDQSVKYGVPNACNGCHADRSARWAATQVRQWYGHDPHGYQRFAAAFASADRGTAGAQAGLRTVAGDTTQPAIVRATAFSEMEAGSSPQTIRLLEQGLRDQDALVRLGALQPLADAPPELRLQLAAPLLSDSRRAVRVDAVGILAAVPAAQFSPQARGAFRRAAREYVQSQNYNADRADARVNLGSFYANQGHVALAVNELRAAIKLQPSYIPAYVNLADVYRASGQDAAGERVLRTGLKLAPDSAVLHYALGLVWVRSQRGTAALDEFRRANALDPASARFAYVYALALDSASESAAAIATLDAALRIHPEDRDILQALVSIHEARGEQVLARKYADRLRSLAVSED